MDFALLSAFVLYFGILFAIASLFYRQTHSAGGFILGGRQLNYWATAISAQASDMGAWLFIGYPAIVYVKGLSQIWTAVGLVLFMWLNWRLVAARLRILTAQYNTLTLWSFFSKRFDDPTNRLRVVGTVVSIIFFVTYITAGLIGISHVLVVDFGLVYHHALIIGALLTSGYILIGGFLAAAWCNVFKGLFLLCAITIVPVIALIHVGGVSSVITAANTAHVSFALLHSWRDLLLIFGWGLGYFGQPQILINFMSIDDVEKINKATRIGILWQIIVLAASICVGLVGLAFFVGVPVSTEHLYLDMVKSLFSPFLTGFVSCGMLASIIATVTVQMLVAASGLSQDFYKTIINPSASSARISAIARIATVLVTLVSTLVAYLFRTIGVYDFTYFSWAGLGSSFGPIVLLSLFNSGINRHGALAAIVGGGLTACIVPVFTSLPALIPGFIVSTLCAYGVTYLTR